MQPEARCDASQLRGRWARHVMGWVNGEASGETLAESRGMNEHVLTLSAATAFMNLASGAASAEVTCQTYWGSRPGIVVETGGVSSAPCFSGLAEEAGVTHGSQARGRAADAKKNREGAAAATRPVCPRCECPHACTLRHGARKGMAGAAAPGPPKLAWPELLGWGWQTIHRGAGNGAAGRLAFRAVTT